MNTNKPAPQKQDIKDEATAMPPLVKQNAKRELLHWAIAALVIFPLVISAFKGTRESQIVIVAFLGYRIYKGVRHAMKGYEGESYLLPSVGPRYRPTPAPQPTQPIEGEQKEPLAAQDLQPVEEESHDLKTSNGFFKLIVMSQAGQDTHVCQWRHKPKLKLAKVPGASSYLQLDGTELVLEKTWPATHTLADVAKELLQSTGTQPQRRAANDPVIEAPKAANDESFKSDKRASKAHGALPIDSGKVTGIGMRTFPATATKEAYESFCLELAADSGATHVFKGASIRDQATRTNLSLGDSIRVADKGWSEVSIPKRDGTTRVTKKHNFEITKL
jgi:hypothetical protein